jgi:hypothetical protein
MRRAFAATACLAATLMVFAALMAPRAAATPGVYQQVLEVYEREGSIPACAFTGVQLQTALSGVDTYGAQYFADFTQAVQTALSSRAGGACAPLSAGAPASPRTARVPPPPAIAVTAASDAGMPLLLILLGAATLLGALGLGLRVIRWSPERHG